jgi:hypothetical protein
MSIAIPESSQLSILKRLFNDQEMSPELADYIIRMQFPQRDIDRMNVLSAKAREGSLTPAEDEELENYLFVEGVLAILQSKARCRLDNAGQG